MVAYLVARSATCLMLSGSSPTVAMQIRQSPPRSARRPRLVIRLPQMLHLDIGQVPPLYPSAAGLAPLEVWLKPLVGGLDVGHAEYEDVDGILAVPAHAVALV